MKLLGYFPFFKLANPEQLNDERQPLNQKKIACLASIGFACLAGVVWNLRRKNPWLAVAISAAGVCVEIALMILLPSCEPTPPLIPNKQPALAPLKVEIQEEDILPQEENKAEENQEALANRLELPKENLLLNLPHPNFSIWLNNVDKMFPIREVNQAVISDKQKGGIMGQACGDAIGLFTEFTTKTEAQQMIDGSIKFGRSYPQKFISGPNWDHIRRFVKNGWTDDTDQALALLRALYRKFNPQEMKGDRWEGIYQYPRLSNLFAIELHQWRVKGLIKDGCFRGRNKPYCMGLGALVGEVVEHPLFLKDPLQTAEQVWAKNHKPMQNRPAANGAVMRTSPIGLIFYSSLSHLVSHTIEACKVTHADPRCVASCVAVNLAIALSLRGYDYENILQVAEAGGLIILREMLHEVAKNNLLSQQETRDWDKIYQTYAKEFLEHMHGNWETLDLDEGYKDPERMNRIGYTFKCMGAAFYALRLAHSYQSEGRPSVFRWVIEEIAAEGGDADTNAAVAGALVGAYLGFEGKFPLNWTGKLADIGVLEQAATHIEKLSLYVQQERDELW